jgi:UDP-N-acetyl-D-glucosamine dehydrogenase
MSSIGSHSEKKNIGIIGLGYVGLPLAILIAEAGYKVFGFDLQENVCKILNSGESHIKDISSTRVKDVVQNNLFIATKNFELLEECDVISICVPTPLNKMKDPDLSYVISATEEIKKFLKKGQLIILESTTFPGTTRQLLLPILESSGLKVGKDFYLCFSPERVDPGNELWNTKNTPKLIGGVTDKCKQLGTEFYSFVFDKIISVSSAEIAELVKVYENTFRMINIALANELSIICDKLNLDVWEVIDAASTKPFGFMKFTPGPGLGGHCIPLDPHYLTWKLRTLDYNIEIIDLASEINSKMPLYIVNKIGDSLNNIYKSFKGSKILIMGIAYKKDIDDIRESPALDIIIYLQKRGANVYFHDPHCPTIINDGHVDIQNLPMNSVSLSDDFVKEMDLVAIITNHSSIDYNIISNNAKIIIDTRGVFKKNIL